MFRRASISPLAQVLSLLVLPLPNIAFG